MYYHDFNRNQSHHIFPLIRKLKHLTVGSLWAFVQKELAAVSRAHDMKAFSSRIADISTGKLAVPPEEGAGAAGNGVVAAEGAVADEGKGGGAGAGANGEPTSDENKGALAQPPPRAAVAAVNEGAAGSAAGSAADSAAAVVFSLAELQEGLPEGVDPANKEACLSSADFVSAFGMSRDEFAALPLWKRNGAKKRAGLF